MRSAVEFLSNAALFGMIVSQFWAGREWLRGHSLLPPSPPRRVPWSAGGVGLVLLLYIALTLLVRLGYEMIDRVTGPVPAVQPAAATGGAAGSLSFTEMMGLVAVLNLLVLLATPAVLRLRCRATLRDLGLSLEHWRRDVVVGGVAFLLVSPWVYAVHAAALVFFPPSAHPMESMLRQEFSPAVVVLAILSGVILAPAAEELIFRGVLLGWLGNPSPRRRETLGDVDAGPTEGEPAPDVIPEDAPSTEGEWRALVGSALPFAVVHATEMPSPIPIFFLALTLAFVVRRTGSLIPGLVLHGLFNGFSTLMLLGSVL